jgi:hypothetical protein
VDNLRAKISTSICMLILEVPVDVQQNSVRILKPSVMSDTVIKGFLACARTICLYRGSMQMCTNKYLFLTKPRLNFLFNLKYLGHWD